VELFNAVTIRYIIGVGFVQLCLGDHVQAMDSGLNTTAIADGAQIGIRGTTAIGLIDGSLSDAKGR
jgi:hypothetical protein